ncbi:MAG: PilZ domain-containing protein [Terriglobales bacterium]
MRDHAQRNEERRRSPRFACGGRARIVSLPFNGVALSGKILDLSLGGCYIETAQPLQRGTLVEVIVQVDASSFRALGRVKDSRDRSGAALEFLQLSAGGRDLLRELVAQLARLRAKEIALHAGDREDDPGPWVELDDGSPQAIDPKERFPVLATVLPPEPREGTALVTTREKSVDEADPETSFLDLFV